MAIRETDQLTKQRDACRLCNDLALDLVTATQAYRTFERMGMAEMPEEIRVGVTRLCLFQIILLLDKWLELYDRYKAVFPMPQEGEEHPLRDEAKRLKKRIEDLGVDDFRDKVVGHVWDKQSKRPLTNSEVEQRVQAITGGDIPGFLNRVNGPEDTYPNTVVSIIEAIKDRLRLECHFSDEELDQ